MNVTDWQYRHSAPQATICDPSEAMILPLQEMDKILGLLS